LAQPTCPNAIAGQGAMGLADLCRLDLDQWLCACDGGAGQLARLYGSSLRWNYDSVEQILALHLNCNPTLPESGFLDAQFFDNVAIKSEDRPQIEASVWEALGSPDHRVRSLPHPKQCTPNAFRGWSFVRWLRDVAGGEQTLLGYTNLLEEHYDDVEQVIELYSIHGDGERSLLNPAFFKDVSIIDEDHRRLFEAWAMKNCLSPEERTAGRSCHGPPVLQSAPANLGGAASDGANGASSAAVASMQKWLLEVDKSGILLQKYLEPLLERYDTPEQVVRLYTQSRASTTWEEQFFVDACIDDSHWLLFDNWLATAQAETSPVPLGRHQSGTGGSNGELCFELVD